EPDARLGGQKTREVGADRHKGGMAQVELSRETGDQIQAQGQDDVDADGHQNAVIVRVDEPAQYSVGPINHGRFTPSPACVGQGGPTDGTAGPRSRWRTRWHRAIGSSAKRPPAPPPSLIRALPPWRRGCGRCRPAPPR